MSGILYKIETPLERGRFDYKRRIVGNMTIKLVLFQPDIPQNTGTMLRLAACLGLDVDVIEPCGFVWSEAKMRRAGMDYLDRVAYERHRSWDHYNGNRTGRLILLTTKADTPYTDFEFRPGDSLMVGRESAGVPDAVHAAADGRVIIPMAPAMRSINVAISASMVLGEALRQTGGFPNIPIEPA